MIASFFVFGANGHGQVVAEAIESSRPGGLLGFIDDGMPVGARTPLGVVVGSADDLPDLLQKNPGAGVVVAIGDNATRRKCVDKLRARCPGAKFPAVHHPSATIAPTAMLGEGAIVLAGAVVGTGAQVDAFALINTRASLDHHGRLGAFASLAPGAATGGGVSLGSGCAIGPGATVLQGRCVGEDAVVGALSLVYHDIPPRSVAYGVPARIVAARDFTKPYLSAPASRREPGTATARNVNREAPIRVVILGAGGHGKEIAWNLRQMNAVKPEFEIIGYCDDAKPAGEIVLGLPVLGTPEQVAARFGGDLGYICGVAKNKMRPALVARAEQAGWSPVSVIHPSAVIAEDVEIGAGSYIAAQCYVGPGARLARHTLVNVIASVGHDVVLEEHTQICPGVKLSGGAIIREGAFLGSNAVVAPGVEVGAWSTVSATAFLSENVPARSFVTVAAPSLAAKPARA